MAGGIWVVRLGGMLQASSGEAPAVPRTVPEAESDPAHMSVMLWLRTLGCRCASPKADARQAGPDSPEVQCSHEAGFSGQIRDTSKTKAESTQVGHSQLECFLCFEPGWEEQVLGKEY